jgi:Ran GTPase-activating protein (RanGAP) involved in mRNA processing and transport
MGRLNQLVTNMVKKLEANEMKLTAIQLSDNWLNDSLLKTLCDAVGPSLCPVTRFCLRNNSVGPIGAGVLSRTLVDIARVTSVSVKECVCRTLTLPLI